MDTTMIVCDTIAVKFRVAADVCQPCVDGTGTNMCDNKNEGAKNGGSNISTDNSDEIAYKREIERQKRVLNLMQEICTLSQDPGSSKDVKGKYNDDAANKLWDLYQKIDSHHKSNVNCSSNISEQQNG